MWVACRALATMAVEWIFPWFPCENYLHRYRRLMMMMSIYRKIYGRHFSRCATHATRYNVVNNFNACACHCMQCQRWTTECLLCVCLCVPILWSLATRTHKHNTIGPGHGKTAAGFFGEPHTVNQWSQSTKAKRNRRRKKIFSRVSLKFYECRGRIRLASLASLSRVCAECQIETLYAS